MVQTDGDLGKVPINHSQGLSMSHHNLKPEGRVYDLGINPLLYLTALLALG